MNGKNVEAAAAPSSSFYHMQSNSDSHRQHQICLEREKFKKTERKRECVRVRENRWVLELELNFRIVKSKSKKKGIWKKAWFYITNIHSVKPRPVLLSNGGHWS